MKIKEVDNKKIVVINLKESNEKLKGKTWSMNYFQESAGGPCDTNSFQHAPNLAKVNYRNI